MGIYQYTLRKDVIETSGMKIARFSFAYKIGRDWEPGGRTSEYRNGKYVKNVAVCRLESQAQRARHALPDVRYAVVCKSFNQATDYSLEVYEVGRSMTQFTEELDPKSIVGSIRKVGSKYVFTPKEVK